MIIFILTNIDMFHTILDMAYNKTNHKWYLTKQFGDN